MADADAEMGLQMVGWTTASALAGVCLFFERRDRCANDQRHWPVQPAGDWTPNPLPARGRDVPGFRGLVHLRKAPPLLSGTSPQLPRLKDTSGPISVHAGSTARKPTAIP